MDKIERSGFKLIGLMLAGKTTNNAGQSNIDCGNLWQMFEKEHIAERIPGKLGNEVYAVYFSYEADHTKPFSYFIGCKVQPETEAPEGMDSLLIPKQSYRKFPAKGKIPECISNVWETIWDSSIERTYTYDFEVYDERSHDWSNAEVNVYIAVKS